MKVKRFLMRLKRKAGARLCWLFKTLGDENWGGSALHCFKVEVENGFMRVVATDGCRIHILKAPIKGKKMNEWQEEIPLMPAGLCRPTMNPKRGSYIMEMEVEEGEFPDWRKVLPEKDVFVVRLNAQYLRQAISHLSPKAYVELYASDHDKPIRMEIYDPDDIAESIERTAIIMPMHKN